MPSSTTTTTAATTRQRLAITVPAGFFDGTLARCAQCGDPLPQYIERDERGIDTARCLTCGALHEAESGRFLRSRYGQMKGSKQCSNR